MRVTSVLSLLLALAGCAAGSGQNISFGQGDDGSGDGPNDGGDDGSGDDGDDGDDGDEGGGAQDDVHEAFEALIAARCDWLFGCCSRGELDLLVGPFTGDAADCAARVIDTLDAGAKPPVQVGSSDLLLYVILSLSQGRVQVDGNAVDACVEHMSASLCTDPGPPPGPDGAAQHCTPPTPEIEGDDPCAPEVLFIGTQEVGQACLPSAPFECEPGLRCVSFGELGVCARPAGEGDPCFTDQECEATLLCDGETGRCVASSPLGGPCAYADPDQPLPGTETEPCAPGLFCDPVGLMCVDFCAPGAPCEKDPECPEDHVCVFGSCSMPLVGGAPCEEAEDCESLVCDEDTSICTQLLGLGMSCSDHAECRSEFCDPSLDSCAPQKLPGQPCESGQDEECEQGVCNDTGDVSECVAKGVDGDACDYTTPCASDYGCVGGICTPKPLLNGSPCTGNHDCVSGLCWNARCEAKSGAGAQCGDAMFKPCEDSAYCEIDIDPMGVPTGTCANKLRAGQGCEDDEQCFGSCVVAWGHRLCDATPENGAAWCDGS
jgi:hypothetical protein